MKAIIYSDLHLHNHQYNSINGETALNFLSFLRSYATNNNIKNVIFAGDFFHMKSRVYAPHVVQSLLQIKDFYKSKIKQYMLVGNHDMPVKNSSMNSILFVFSDYAEIIFDYHFIDTEKTRIHFLCYTEDKFNSFIIDKSKQNVLISHLPVKGFSMANNYISKEGWSVSDFKQFDLVILGHYHKFQHNHNIVYVGSPYQIDVSERDDEHGFLEIDFDTLKWKFIPYKDAPVYKIVEISDYKDLTKTDLTNSFAKIKITNKNLDIKKIQEKAISLGALTVNIIPEFDSKDEKKKTKEFNVINSDPISIARAYLGSFKKLSFNKKLLLDKFKDIESITLKDKEYDI